MAKVRLGQPVYAPVYRLAGSERAPFALVRGVVRSIEQRSCDVELDWGGGLYKFAISLVHVAVGVCIVRIGDFKTELAALDPICKSILNFLKLLLPDDQVRLVELRTDGEFDEYFQLNASIFAVWIIVGHGTEAGELCFTNGHKSASKIVAAKLAPHAAVPKTFLFLSCHAGRSAFARAFSSQKTLCNVLIAPIGALHSAVASQFTQTLLTYFYLEGRQIGVAFNKAVAATPAGTRFRLWRNGVF